MDSLLTGKEDTKYALKLHSIVIVNNPAKFSDGGKEHLLPDDRMNN
jgi:hypothetical protein